MALHYELLVRIGAHFAVFFYCTELFSVLCTNGAGSFGSTFILEGKVWMLEFSTCCVFFFINLILANASVNY